MIILRQVSAGKGSFYSSDTGEDSVCTFIDNIHTICISLTLEEIFTHHAIQYLSVSGAPG